MRRLVGVGLLGGLALLAGDQHRSTRAVSAPAAVPAWHSPNDVVVAADGSVAYVVDTTADGVAVVDLGARAVRARVPVGAAPVAAALSADGQELFVACRHAHRVDVVDVASLRVVRALRTSFEPYGLQVAADGAHLYVTHSVADTVACLALPGGEVRWETACGRDPRSVVAFDGGRRLAVGNSLSRDVALLDAATGAVLERRALDRGSLARDVVVTADDRHAIVAHVVSHDEQMTLQMERGWIHSNGLSVLDLARPGHRVTVLLDRILVGAANPWGLALSRDGRTLYVTLAGVHEVALVDVAGLLALVAETPPGAVERLAQDVEVVAARGVARFAPSGGEGPRGVAVDPATGDVLVANYFSEDVTVLDGGTGALRALLPLGEGREPDLERRGEMLFNDARLCFQRWFSCASCHQEDATVDGLNWDLANDGLGNPKNVKSMHDIADTPPAMWSGVRADMDAAVAAGQRFLGLLPEPENHRALMAFLGAQRRAPNPYREHGDQAQLRRGEELFRTARCVRCHPPPTYTDRKLHAVAAPGPFDQREVFDTPSLRECYRTAPYMHDGRCATLHEVLELPHARYRGGALKNFTKEQMDDLVAFLRSL